MIVHTLHSIGPHLVLEPGAITFKVYQCCKCMLSCSTLNIGSMQLFGNIVIQVN
jgi:hypothetical protein